MQHRSEYDVQNQVNGIIGSWREVGYDAQQYTSFRKKLQAIGLTAFAAATLLRSVANPPATTETQLRGPPTPKKLKTEHAVPSPSKRKAADSFVTPDKNKPRIRGISPFDKKAIMPTHIDDDDDMHGDQDAQIEAHRATAKAAGSAGTRSQQTTGGMGQETRITPQQPHYGLSNTVTAVLPHVLYFTAVTGAVTTSNPTLFKFRLNTPFDTVISTFSTPVASAAYAAGLYDKMAGTGNTSTWQSSLVNYPASTTSGTSEAPQWRDWYSPQYGYYAVIGLEYEITCYNPQRFTNADAVMCTYIDTFSANNATLIHPTNATMHQMQYWPDVDFYKLASRNDGVTIESYRTIKGHYRPGQGHKNVENDEDIKTWTKIGSTPSLNEQMTIGFGKGWTTDVVTPQPVNVRVSLRWICQFKDTANQFRWPTTGQTPISVTGPTDIFALN